MSDPISAWALRLSHAADWAEASIRLWIGGAAIWPPDNAPGSSHGEEHVQALASAKSEWSRLQTPQLLKRLTAPEKDALFSCLDLFELAGLRLRQAYVTGDRQHLHDALSDLKPANTDFESVAGKVFGVVRV